jgi:NTE family protein
MRKIALVLSSGGPRGAAHIGVLKVLAEQEIPISLIVGSSIGALCGGVYAAGVGVAQLEREWLTIDFWRIAKSLQPTLPIHGWSSGSAVERFLREIVGGDRRIEELPIPFVAVATDLDTGERVLLREGSLITAIRASFSIPGLFVPVERDGKHLADGGLVSPLPVDVARQLGADAVIAVDVNLGSKRYRIAHPPQGAPGLFEALDLAVSIFVWRLTELTLAIAPPDVLITPQMPDDSLVGNLSYHRAEERIALGEAAAREKLREIQELLRGL